MRTDGQVCRNFKIPSLSGPSCSLEAPASLVVSLGGKGSRVEVVCVARVYPDCAGVGVLF